jgi:BlaI family transcriptional regulator, penicillinase repressor
MAPFDDTLSARERQIMDAVHMLGEATVAQVREEMPDPPSLNAVRTMLGTLTDKRLLKKSYAGRAAVYSPGKEQTRTAREAMSRVLKVFHGGSIASALRLHLSDPKQKLSKTEIENLNRLIEEAIQRRGDE